MGAKIGVSVNVGNACGGCADVVQAKDNCRAGVRWVVGQTGGAISR
jgi:hypothetical protein